jgi:hypothetical protein
LLYGISQLLDKINGYAARCFVYAIMLDKSFIATLLVILSSLYANYTRYFIIMLLDNVSHSASVYSLLSHKNKFHIVNCLREITCFKFIYKIKVGVPLNSFVFLFYIGLSI